MIIVVMAATFIFGFDMVLFLGRPLMPIAFHMYQNCQNNGYCFVLGHYDAIIWLVRLLTLLWGATFQCFLTDDGWVLGVGNAFNFFEMC